MGLTRQHWSSAGARAHGLPRCGKAPHGVGPVPLGAEGSSLVGEKRAGTLCSSPAWAQGTSISCPSVFPRGPWVVLAHIQPEPYPARYPREHLCWSLSSFLCRTFFSCTLHLNSSCAGAPAPSQEAWASAELGAYKTYVIRFSSHRECCSFFPDIWCLDNHCPHILSLSDCLSSRYLGWNLGSLSLFPSLPSSPLLLFSFRWNSHNINYFKVNNSGTFI